MRRLSDTIRRLHALRSAQPHGLQGLSPADHLSDLTGFGSNPGALRGRFYTPKSLPQNAPLVVVLHGCTQTAAGYDHGSGWSQLADEAGFAVVYPEQQRANNQNLCFNWFQPADTTRGSGEVLSIRQMVGTMIAEHGLDPRRVFVTGLSAGGAMAAALLGTYPDVFAGGAVIAGLPYGSATNIPEAFDRMRGHGGPSTRTLQDLLRGASTHAGPWPILSVWQGMADQTVAPSNADALIAQWRGVHHVDEAPTRTDRIGDHQRRCWSDSSGREVLELVRVARMGHGTPLQTRGQDGLGASGPFMIDAGISSTRHIARFWGLSASADRRTFDHRPAGRDLPTSRSMAPERDVDPRPTASGHGGDKNDAPPSARPNSVQKVIEDALRSAGLMPHDRR